MTLRSKYLVITGVGLALACGSLTSLAQEEPNTLELTPVSTADGEGAAGDVATTPTEGDGVEGQEGGGALRGIFEFLANKGSKALQLDDAEANQADDETDRRVTELKQLATLAIKRDRVSESMRHISELISLKPYDPDMHLALGLCHRRLGNYRDAEKKYKDVLDLGGPKSLISLLTAEAHAVDTDKDGALRHLKEAAVAGRNIFNDVGMLPKLQEYRDDTEFIKLALQLEKFELSGQHKHDPFTNPFPLKSLDNTITTGPTITKVSLSPEEQDQLLKEAKKAFARVSFYVKLEDESKAMRAYNHLREILEQRDLVTVPKLQSEFRFLETRMEEVEVKIEGIRLKFYYNEAKDKITKMKDDFLDGEYLQVGITHSEILKLTEEMAAVNSSYQPVANGILKTANTWLRRANVRQEFANEKPTIQGIVIGGDQEKMAVLNDRIVRQGEAVRNFRVVKVESNRVTFRYKGEEIPLVFRRY